MPSKKISFDKISEKNKALKLESTSITRIILVKDVSDFFKHSYRFFFTFIFVSHPPSSSAHFYRSFSGFLREQKKKMGGKNAINANVYIIAVYFVSSSNRFIYLWDGEVAGEERGWSGDSGCGRDERLK